MHHLGRIAVAEQSTELLLELCGRLERAVGREVLAVEAVAGARDAAGDRMQKVLLQEQVGRTKRFKQLNNKDSKRKHKKFYS